MSLNNTEEWASMVINNLFDNSGMELDKNGEDLAKKDISENKDFDHHVDAFLLGTEAGKDSSVTSTDYVTGSPIQSKSISLITFVSNKPEIRDKSTVSISSSPIENNLKKMDIYNDIDESVSFTDCEVSRLDLDDSSKCEIIVSSQIQDNTDFRSVCEGKHMETPEDPESLVEDLINKCEILATEFRRFADDPPFCNANGIRLQNSCEKPCPKMLDSLDKVDRVPTGEEISIYPKRTESEDEMHEDQLKKVDEKVERLKATILENQSDSSSKGNGDSETSFMNLYSEYFSKRYIEEEMASRFEEQSEIYEYKCESDVDDVTESRICRKFQNVKLDVSEQVGVYLDYQKNSGCEHYLEEIPKRDESISSLSETNSFPLDEPQIALNTSTDKFSNMHYEEDTSLLEESDGFQNCLIKNSVRELLSDNTEQLSNSNADELTYRTECITCERAGISKRLHFGFLDDEEKRFSDDDVIVKRAEKIVMLYRIASSTFELICVKPFAVFLAEAFDFIIFIFVICICLLCMFYSYMKAHLTNIFQQNNPINTALNEIADALLMKSITDERAYFAKDSGFDNYDESTEEDSSISFSLINNDSVDVHPDAKLFIDIIAPEGVSVLGIKFEQAEKGLDSFYENVGNYLAYLKEQQNKISIKASEVEKVDIVMITEDSNYMRIVEENLDIRLENLEQLHNTPPKRNARVTYTIVNDGTANKFEFQNSFPDISCNEESFIFNSTAIDDALPTKGIRLSQFKGDCYCVKGNHLIPLNSSAVGYSAEMCAPALYPSNKNFENSFMNVNLSSSMDFSLTQPKGYVSPEASNEPNLLSSSVQDVKEISMTSEQVMQESDEGKKVRPRRNCLKCSESILDLSEDVSRKCSTSSIPNYSDSFSKETNCAIDGQIVLDNECDIPVEVSQSLESSNIELDSLTLESSSSTVSKAAKKRSGVNIRRRMSLILNNWKNMNVMQCVTNNSGSRKKYKKHFDDIGT